MKRKHIIYLLIAIASVALLALCVLRPKRFDLTADKRHSLGKPTVQMLSKIKKPIEVTIYLAGDLPAEFVTLNNAVVNLLDEMGHHTASSLTYNIVNPSEADSEEQRQQQINNLIARGIKPTIVYDSDKQGNSRQILIFPWADVHYAGKTIPVNLLKNISGNGSAENINASIETLEYEFVDALLTLNKQQIRHIAFLEGHGELPEQYTYDISVALSRYFQVDRGVLMGDASVLDNFEAVIIADPQQPFSEADKYIIDQYIMRGGKVLWLLDGVRFDIQSLSTQGLTPAMALDLNLTDMLFHYGVRVNGCVVEDEQCALVPVNVASPDQPADFQPVPWYLQPLLQPSPVHPITSHIGQVSARFASTIDFVGGTDNVAASVLLISSEASHVTPTPAKIDLQPKRAQDEYFNASYLPVAAVLEGSFTSAFAHRIRPDSLVGVPPFANTSVPTRQAVVACGSIIRNELQNGQPLPLGFDRYTQMQFGNKDFILNTVLYLTDRQGWLSIRQKNIGLRLLNPTALRRDRALVQTICIAMPLLLLALLATAVIFIRYKKTKK